MSFFLGLLLLALLASGPPAESYRYTAFLKAAPCRACAPRGGLFTAGRSPHAQLGVRNDIAELRQYLGLTYPSVVQRLDAKNQILLRNVQPLAPAQAAQMRQRMQVADHLPADRPMLSARIDNVGQGLLTLIFEDDFIVEQANFIFCPAEPANPAKPERVMTIQVLLDESRALAPTVALLQSVYQMPAPLPPGSEYIPALTYPFAQNLPVTVWSIGTLEAFYQPVVGNPLVTGQFWMTDKAVVMQCMNPPKL